MEIAERVRVSHFTKWIKLSNKRYLLMNHPRNVMMFAASGVISALQGGRLNELPTEVFSRLLDQGYVTYLTHEEEDRWISEVVDNIETDYQSLGQPKNYCFITTYRCNLSCSYCFQSNGEIRTVTNRMLTAEEAEAGLQVMASDAKTLQPGGPRSRVMLFGGEPLLPRQREVVEAIVRGCRELSHALEATTNGFFLEVFDDLLGPGLIEHLQISLDGPPEIHNTRRIPINGVPTFDKIWKNIRRALEKGCTISLRCNIDKRNLRGFVELAEFLDSEGVLDDSQLQLRYSRVVPDFESQDAKSDVALDYDEIEAYLIKTMEERPVLRKVAAPEDIQDFATWIGRKFPKKTSRHCGAVQNNVYFGPGREVYPCHETVGKVELSIGVYKDGTVQYNDSRPKWTNRRADRLTTCRRCPYILVCAGGCAAHVDLNGEPLRSNCEGFDAKYSLAVQRAYAGDQDFLADGLAAETC